jgi:hypothetical protein
VPAINRDLAGDQQRSPVAAIVDDLEQIAALLCTERFWPPIIESRSAERDSIYVQRPVM